MTLVWFFHLKESQFQVWFISAGLSIITLCLTSYFIRPHLSSTVSPFILPFIFPLHSLPSTCLRLFGMTGVIRTNSSNRHTLGLHPYVTWPDFINPLVLLLLYYTLVALLHKWVHITEEVCVCVHVCQRSAV